MSEHRGPMQRISPIRLAFGVLAAIALAVGILLGQKGQSGGPAAAAADTCRPGERAGADVCPSPSATPSPSPGTGSGSSAGSGSSVSSGPSVKRATPAPSTAAGAPSTATATGSGTRATTSVPSGHGRPASRPPGGQDPILDLRLPPVTLPTCIVDCR